MPVIGTTSLLLAEAKAALAQDYAAMVADEVMVGDALSFDALLDVCADLEAKINSEYL